VLSRPPDNRPLERTQVGGGADRNNSGWALVNRGDARSPGENAAGDRPSEESEMRRTARGQRGFTLVELLTVIAIVAILAAIMLPVISTVRANAWRGACITHLHQIEQALKMYRDTFGVYPEHLLGYVTPTGQRIDYLYPNFVKDERTFRCPVAPVVFGQGTPVPMYDWPTGTTLTGKRFAPWNSYDGQFRPNSPTTGQYYVHYRRKWTPGPISLTDDPRQLIFRQPSEQTVVTACLYHATWTGGTVARGELALVLFLDGRVKSLPAEKYLDLTQAEDRNWRISPGE